MNEEDEIWMRRAVSLAALGRGRVEPNPQVGCVLVRKGQLIGQGYHRQFGQAHAEVEAIADAVHRGHDTRGATAYVTLEPCSHFGKTPPCSQALIAAQVHRIVVATLDPSPHAAGGGLAQLRQAGIQVDVGVLEQEALWILAPFLKRLQTGLPWIIAKWAMSLDGKLATRTGHSQWISGPPARQLVHDLRGDVDAIVVGIGTALADDPTLTARPPSPRQPNRIATRIVVDRQLRIRWDSKLVQTAAQAPVLVACDPHANPEHRRRLQDAGVEVWSPTPFTTDSADPSGTHCPADRAAGFDYDRLTRQLLSELAQRGMTNVLAEGGGALLGNLFDQNLIDEAYVFVSPKVLGGTAAVSPVGGRGLDRVPPQGQLKRISHRVLGDDVLIHGFITP
jgi:diaminohydroxyphosphoribosylaminopyrimidine deaminase/5-amino-6-(5-phosphoribosylamino)uracil reductase